LVVGLTVLNEARFVFNVEVLVKFLELAYRELSSIFGDYGVDPKSQDNVLPHKLLDLFGSDFGKGLNLNPFHEVVHKLRVVTM